MILYGLTILYHFDDTGNDWPGKLRCLRDRSLSESLTGQINGTENQASILPVQVVVRYLGLNSVGLVADA